MFSPNLKNNRQFKLKERWNNLGKIILPKPKLTLFDDGNQALAGSDPTTVHNGRNFSGSTDVPPAKSGAPAGRGTPCVPAKSAATTFQNTRRGALHAPADSEIDTDGTSPAPTAAAVGRGTPCVPAESESAGLESIDLGDRYTVLSKLGQGGSASVYKVQNNKLGKIFAAKVMRPELLTDDHAQLRFKQEAEAASCLTHPNLVAIYGSSITSDKAPYLLMDYLNGKTLAETLKEEGSLENARSINILIQCCEALVHMHMKGIVHRDIKPSNIFLTKAENGTDMVKIVDFGIAKIQAYQDSTHLTQTGAVFGSPLYMSPEQCRGESLDSRSDIYSLGCVAYEMLTGVSPFAASNPIKTIVNHVNGVLEPLSKSTIEHPIPQALQQIIMRCLETEPKKRYQTVDELLSHLVGFRDNGKVQEAPCEVSASLYKRFGASVIDGLILTILLFAATSLVGLGLHLPFDVYSQLCRPQFYVSALTWTWLWLGFTILFGPAIGTMFILATPMPFLSDSTPTQIGHLIRYLYIFKLAFGLILSWFYFAAFESSKCCGTPGKKIFGLAVVDSQGTRLTFLQATARYFLKILLVPIMLSIMINQYVSTCRLFQKNPLKIAAFRMWKDLRLPLHSPSRPLTDDWSKAYVVNSTALNNPHIPNLNEHLQIQGTKNLNEVSDSIKDSQINAFVFFVIAGPVVFYGLGHCWSGNFDSLLLSSYFFCWIIAPFLYYFRLSRRKREILADRKQRAGPTGLAIPKSRSNV